MYQQLEKIKSKLNAQSIAFNILFIVVSLMFTTFKLQQSKEEPFKSFQKVALGLIAFFYFIILYFIFTTT